MEGPTRPDKYRFRLPTGEVYLIENLAWGKQAHPTAHIDQRLVADADGAYIPQPYEGRQPYEITAAQAERRVADAPPDYDAMKVPELRAEIARRGLDEPPAGARKDDLIAVLTAADQGESGQEAAP